MRDCLRRYAAGGVVLAAVLATGCYEQGKRLNAPPQGDSSRPSDLQRPFVHMTDNATLQDSSVADIHFEPHVSDLNGLGIRKLTRMGELLSVTGGTIHYETSSRDEALISARLSAVREFLAQSGFNMETIAVEAGMARSATMPASHAIEAQKKAAEAAAGSAGAAALPIGAGPT